VLSVLARRWPLVDVDVLPVPVQGREAPPAIVTMLRKAAASGRYDVLLLTRGGGSLEDLWAFNDERVARAIHASSVPVVSAVGHEIDFSIADFVADLRAPTPVGSGRVAGAGCPRAARHLDQLRQRIVAIQERRLAGTHPTCRSSAWRDCNRNARRRG
jgi:exodeoxyribonuclease VII large subunit